ncbi:hypothetical protein [Actinomadura rudentiformis]|uniref:DUF4314 domain-containing protein n=1 Tax=Actinomadura rudentiformis TaxID=359158 RepID=A0A6H9YT79_9ACTN|nr:hypothetical protein [Actinomadura rudentiformis]KAB2347370.1 hypothetical protein F8566_20370 [Actinomadura rudentiformis]
MQFHPRDRVLDTAHAWTTGLSSTGTVVSVDASGGVYVDWDGEGVDLIPMDPVRLVLETCPQS